MILENSKKIIIKPSDILRILMSLIFLSAGIFRIFNPMAAEAELIRLGLPAYFTWFILVIEIGGGVMLLLGKFVKQVSAVFILFLVFALITGLMINGREIISQAGELFVFDANSTDFFMHLVFLVILVFLLLKNNKS
jgi:uncharacterized membrane protein YphA (DoxX/SURF4 family)